MTTLAGSCQCGSITFTSELEPMFVNQCNCERCRKMFGVVQASAIFADHEVEFNGEPSIYTFEGGSGGKYMLISVQYAQPKRIFMLTL